MVEKIVTNYLATEGKIQKHYYFRQNKRIPCYWWLIPYWCPNFQPSNQEKYYVWWHKKGYIMCELRKGLKKGKIIHILWINVFPPPPPYPRWPKLIIFTLQIFKASALWADAFYKSKCRMPVRPSVCPSVRLFTFEVPFKRLFAPTSQSLMSNIF